MVGVYAVGEGGKIAHGASEESGSRKMAGSKLGSVTTGEINFASTLTEH